MEGRADIAREQAARFLQQAGDYHLGNLPTESRHPLTYELAHLACRDLPRALHTLKQIDCSSIEGVLSKVESFMAGAPPNDDFTMLEVLYSA